MARSTSNPLTLLPSHLLHSCRPKTCFTFSSVITALALCCLIGSLAGCAHEEGIVLSEKDMPPAQALYERLTTDPAPGKTLTGILHVTATVPGGRYTFKIATAARKPDCLRMEDLSVIGLPDFMLTASGTEVRLFLPRTGEFLVGNETSEHVLRIFPPAVKPSDLVALLYGQPPALPHGVKSLKVSVDRNRFRLDVYAGGNWAQSLWVEPGTGRLSRLEVADGNGRAAWSARMQDFTETGSPAVPGRIDIETEGMGRVRLSLRNADAEFVDGDNDPDFFLLKPPPK